VWREVQSEKYGGCTAIHSGKIGCQREVEIQLKPSGEAFSRKKITHIARERFTPENMIYSQLFIDYVSSKNPYKLKFFYEAGVKTPDVGTRNYGHAPVGQRCVEIIQKCESPNITLNLLTSLYEGVGYFNLLNGPTDTVKFLDFFYEASQNASPLTD
jgi:hypothetical protein